MNVKCVLTGDRVVSATSNRSVRTIWARVRAVLHCWEKRMHNRQSLAELDGHLLNDIGMSKEQQMREVSKPFWKA